MSASGVFLHTGNRAEVLAEALAGALAREPGDPLRREVVMVPNRGVANWLRLALSRRLGVLFNTAFPFPRAFFEELARAAALEVAGEAEWLWRVHAALGTPADGGEEGSADAECFAESHAGDLARMQLAERLNRVFDDACVTRPARIANWEHGEEADAWQARLWRRVRAGGQTVPLGLALSRMVRGDPGSLDLTGLPERLWVFCLPSLPPLFIDTLRWLGEAIPVHWFALQPTPDYLDDLDAGAGAPGAALLASLGRASRDLQNLLLDRDLPPAAESFQPPAPDHLLGRLQGALFAGAMGEAAPAEPAEADATLQVHRCANAYREVEALRTALLERFQTQADLQPSEVIVMTPDVETYGPLVEAVFRRGDALAIPVSVARTGTLAEGARTRALRRLLDLCGTRLSAREVYAFLEEPAVAQAQGWTPETLRQIRGWIEESAIAWGRDGAHRRAEGFSAFEANSWRFGSERLLLGVAMDPQEGLDFGGRFPCENVEGLQALLLGEVLSFLDGLFAWMEEGARARSAPEWAHWLETALSRFLGWSEGTGADRGIERVLENLRAGRGNGAAGFDREALVFLLGRWLEETMEGRGGGVRVGGINLYRGVPARVIVLLGLNDGLFPRREETTGFDLRQAPRPGDPDPAESDRQAFLEAVLSAREALVITHTGCAADGTTEVPPSPVVDDLLETLERMGPGVTSLREAVVRAHPLQPWSPRIFTAGNGFTYDPREVERVRAAQGCSSQSPAFAPEALPAPPTDGPLALEALQAFFADPAGSFLAERLGAIPPRPEELLPEHEPLPEENRRGYAIRRELFEALCRAEAPEAALARLEGRGMLPAGQTGAQAVAVYLDQARQLAGLVQSRAAGREPAEVPLAGEAVHGRLYPVYGDTLVAVRPGKLRARDRMEGWLALLCAAAAGIPVTEALVAGTDGVCRLAPPESAAELLAALLELREEGMRRPLALFPESAWAAANRLKRAKPEAEAYAAAWQSWRGNPRTATFAESTRPANQLCFPGEPVFDAAFLEHVRQSYLPLAQHLNDEGKARAS